MSGNEVEGIKKLYYSISEVSEKTGLAPHVLRYWETEFKELHPKKNRAGNRVYTQDDLDILERIQRLLREDKYTLEGARQALRRGEGGPDMDARFRRELQDIRSFLVELLERL
jgi:DNA-binding transcriptional MerR regulator